MALPPIHFLHAQVPSNVVNGRQLDELNESDWQAIQEYEMELEQLHQEYDGPNGKKLPPSSVNPTQEKKTATTEAAGNAGTCILSQLVSNTAKKGFDKLAEKTAGVLANANLVPVYVPGLEAKEVGTVGGYAPSWDEIGYCLTNTIIQAISQATIDWINGGFNGNPVFVDDPEKLFRDIGEDTLNSFIDSFGNGILCKQFDINIKLSLIGKERPRKKYNCTYDYALWNLQNKPITMRMFTEYTQIPTNNPMGAFLTLDSDLLAFKDSRTNAATQELSWSSGYFSWKDKEGKTVTPGKIVQSTVEERLNLPTGRLVLADEFNEVLDALVNQLVKTAVQETLGN